MFQTLAIILLIYFILKYLGRIFVPILVRRFAHKMQERFQQQFNNQQNNWEDLRKKEGEVSIESNNDLKDNQTNDLGEYVDFEEVEE